MSTKDNKKIARLFFVILDTGDLRSTNEIIAEDFVNHNPFPDLRSDREGFREFIAMMRTAFPDLRIAIEDQIAEEDIVVTRYTARGTHRGTFLGIPATGRPVTWSAFAQHRIVRGKIKELWFQWGQFDMAQQLDWIPEPALIVQRAGGI